MTNTVGPMIRKARTGAGITQEQLAKEITGLSASDITRAERGEMIPTQEQLKAIAKVTGVTQKSLLDAAKESKTDNSSSGTSGSTGGSKKPAGSTSTGGSKKPADSTSTENGKKPAGSTIAGGSSFRVAASLHVIIGIWRRGRRRYSPVKRRLRTPRCPSRYSVSASIKPPPSRAPRHRRASWDCRIGIPR